MTLEDFFTLTEMKDGLTAPSRVHELVSVMQKEKDSIVKNIGDASRQWAAVASTIAATENKDCLDLFIQLDGLWFIDRWLKDAQKYGSDTADSFIEESITSLLRALEKLQIDRERSVSSGIWNTINHLLDHSSSRVQDRARTLFDGWKQDQIGGIVGVEQSVSPCCDATVLPRDSDKRQLGALPVSKFEAHIELETNSADPAMEERLLLKSSDSVNSEGRENDKSKQNDESLTCRSVEDKPLDGPTTSMTSGSVHESPSRMEKLPVEAPVADQIHWFSVPKAESLEPRPDATKKPSHLLDESDVASSNVKPGANSSNITSSSNNVAESVGAPTIESEDAEICAVTTTFEDQEKPACATNCSSNAIGDANKCDAQERDSKAMDGQFDSNTDRVSSDHEDRLEKADEAGTTFSRMDNSASDDSREDSSDGAKDLKDISRFSKAVMRKRSPNFTDKGTYGNELDYGLVDALEVARQVAQEVERQVVDYKEPACSSSSEKILKSGFRQPDSPDSISGKPESPPEVPPEEVPSRQNYSAEAYSEGEERLTGSNNIQADVEDGANEQESSQVTEVAQEPELNDAKGFCGLDLNQDICSDEMDPPVNPVSTTLSVVSASRPTAASGSPAGCVQFQGTLGWKGSSATSAFRPASPCKMPDFDRTHETRRFGESLEQRQNCLGIDLNLTEDGDEKALEFKLGRQISVSTGLHSGESSLDVRSKRSDRPNLDLNRLTDDGDALPSDARTDRQLFFPRNGHRSASPASSSSSMQPSLRNFDLNDQPLFANDSSDQGHHLGKSSQNVAGSFGGTKTMDPVISLFGAKVEVGRRVESGTKDFIPQAQLLPNGKPPQPAVDVNISRMGGVLGMVPSLPYTHPTAFGYNALTTAQPPAVYGPGGPIPYMLDSIGAHVVPQIMGSSSGVPLSYAQQPFIMSMAGAPIPLNGVVSSRPTFDLNSGVAVEGTSSGGIRQLFMPGQGRSLEEHLGSNPQATSSSGGGGKRKEPDSGWEPFPLHYKQHPQPPWR